MEAGGVEKDYTDTLWLLAAIKSITWGKKQVQIHISVHWERQKQLCFQENVWLKTTVFPVKYSQPKVYFGEMHL